MVTKEMVSTDAKVNFGALIDYALRGGATIIKRYQKPSAVVIGHDAYERFMRNEAELHYYKGLAEARENAARADANGTWVSLEEMDRIMAPHVGN